MARSSTSTSEIRSFRDLYTYELALQQSDIVYQVTCGFPIDERFALSDQIRRSSRAVGALIAEGWARRRYPKAFVNCLSQALGEASETQSWLDQAKIRGYISATQYEEMDDAWQHIGAMLSRMIIRADKFYHTHLP